MTPKEYYLSYAGKAGRKTAFWVLYTVAVLVGGFATIYHLGHLLPGHPATVVFGSGLAVLLVALAPTVSRAAKYQAGMWDVAKERHDAAIKAREAVLDGQIVEVLGGQTNGLLLIIRRPARADLEIVRIDRVGLRDRTSEATPRETAPQAAPGTCR